jgi:pyruvate dehydrogenase E2 component (dihydrolipoamide acetyltransferase)
MPTEIIMPKVDMDMASGKLMTWHIEAGARAEKGAPLFDIETDKAAMEVEAEGAGFVYHRAEEGSEIAIGRPVAWLYAEGEAVGPRPVLEPGPALVADALDRDVPEERAPEARGTLPEPQAERETRATPSARRVAREAGLDLSEIEGSGPMGRVQRADVEALQRPAGAPASADHQPGPLAVTSRPGTGVPLVMIHGFAGDAMSWAGLDPALAGRATHRIELPSHGKSPLRCPPDFAALAKELRQAVDALQLDSFDLVGHSLGGALALALADIRPRKLRQMTLLAPAGLGPEVNGATLDGLCRATRPESLKPWLKTLTSDPDLITDAFARLAFAARSAPMRAAQGAMADRLFPDGVQAFDLRGALARLTVPTRLVWGKEDRIVPWKHALCAPGPVALHLFDKMGHVPHLEAPDAIGEMLLKPL